ncbi:glycosyltransferase family 4 protein [Shewanella salipaludis]|uniref:Glycosyltransferase family 4 protein n=1 Tax=Shewanella salipaludis TaxID=2723052 RepID=A0A972JKP7_9GAMM|nr:glycosyltransferase family 4 protein [Shewanella salipaludis]NMH65364.1 glycosyltransferase family 4 protein [Shewanella salipaludis]
MHINILARPDHSLKLFEQLLKIKSEDDVIKLYTFYALRKGSVANNLFPKFKTAPEQAIVLMFFTFITRISNIFLRKIGVNTRENEIRMFRAFAPKAELAKADVLHYWPFYCAGMVKQLKGNKNMRTVAEYYEAEPSFVNSIYDDEYKKFAIKTEKKINTLIDQNACFEFEDNFIVASEFTKKTYELKYPNKNYYVCKYGPAGYPLDKNSDFFVSKKCEVFNIVFVGQICVEKGVHYLIEAVKNIDVKLDLVGPIRNGQEKIFSKMISENKNVKHLGPKRHSEILDILRGYDLFCLPSLADNYSLAVVEALSVRIPVVVTENCGNAEDVKRYNLGLVATVKNADSLKACIMGIKTNFDFSLFNDGLEEFFSLENQLVYPKAVLDVYKMIAGSY